MGSSLPIMTSDPRHQQDMFPAARWIFSLFSLYTLKINVPTWKKYILANNHVRICKICKAHQAPTTVFARFKAI